MQKLKKMINKTNLLSIISIIFYIMRVFEIKENKIVCMNFKGKSYGDNPKYIVNELLNRNKDYEIIWFVKQINKCDFPENIKLVKIYSLRYFYEMCTAKVWISNVRMPSFVRKRKGQYYIQTWHGGLGIKKIEADAQKSLTKYYIKSAKNDSNMMDLAISNCAYRTKIYKESFWYSGEILESGSPRNDIFFIENKEVIISKIKQKYGIKKEEKIILYAPTFRTYKFDYLDIDIKNIMMHFKEQYECKFLVKLHPKIKKSLNKSNLFIDVSDYPDMDELLLATEILITDYSSLMFDFIFMNKPVYLYSPDFARYSNERGINFNYKQLPFSISYSKDELSRKIISEDYKNYNDKLENFIEKMNIKDEGKASSIICDRIENVMKR